MRLSLGENDGWLCVEMTVADSEAPQLITNLYQTTTRMHDARYHYGDDLADCTVKQDMAHGRWGIYHRKYATVYVHCEHYGQELPCKGHLTPIKPPRVGKGSTVEWYNGRWHIYTAAGKHRRVDAI